MPEITIAQISNEQIGLVLIAVAIILLIFLIYRLHSKKKKKGEKKLQEKIDKQLDSDKKENKISKEEKKEVETIESSIDKLSIFADLEKEPMSIEDINSKLSKHNAHFSMKVEESPDDARKKLLSKIIHLQKLLDTNQAHNAHSLGCYTGKSKSNKGHIAINYKILPDSTVTIGVFGDNQHIVDSIIREYKHVFVEKEPEKELLSKINNLISEKIKAFDSVAVDKEEKNEEKKNTN